MSSARHIFVETQLLVEAAGPKTTSYFIDSTNLLVRDSDTLVVSCCS